MESVHWSHGYRGSCKISRGYRLHWLIGGSWNWNRKEYRPCGLQRAHSWSNCRPLIRWSGESILYRRKRCKRRRPSELSNPLQAKAPRVESLCQSHLNWRDAKIEREMSRLAWCEGCGLHWSLKSGKFIKRWSDRIKRDFRSPRYSNDFSWPKWSLLKGHH